MKTRAEAAPLILSLGLAGFVVMADNWVVSPIVPAIARDIATAPRARLAVTTIGSISGVRPTATAIAKRKASFQPPLTNPFSRKTTGTMTNMNRISTQVTRLTPLSKLVGARWFTTLFASDPNCVRAPVRITSAVAVPLTRLVPMKQRVTRAKAFAVAGDPESS